jgi:DNA-binding transcriptional MerR regulator
MKNVYLVKDLSAATGISVDSIKYYCKLGLIKEEARGFGTNFRYFGDRAVLRLKEIRLLRTQRYSLREIRSLLEKETST